MSFKVPEDILICNEEAKAKAFVEKVWGKRPTFICVIGNTETAKIPGISAAGAVPAITDFTPAADIELLYYGRCKCIDGVPVTPNGIPTPALVTMSAIGQSASRTGRSTVFSGFRIFALSAMKSTPQNTIRSYPVPTVALDNASESPRMSATS